MDRRARTALERSIEHWLRLAECKSVDDVYDEGIGYEGCDLCHQFHRDGCHGCPVGDAGHHLCGNTPYEPALEYVDGAEEKEYEFDVEKWRPLAEAEVNFLKGLREE